MKKIFYSIEDIKTTSELYDEVLLVTDETIKKKQKCISVDNKEYDNAIKQLILKFLERTINDREDPNYIRFLLVKKSLNETVLWSSYVLPDPTGQYALRITDVSWKKIESIYKDALNDICKKYNIYPTCSFRTLKFSQSWVTFKSYTCDLYFLDSFGDTGDYDEEYQYVTYTTKEGNAKCVVDISRDEIINGGKELCSRLKLDDTAYLKALKYELDTAKENISKAKKRVKTLKEKLRPLEEKYDQLDDGEKLMLEVMDISN